MQKLYHLIFSAIIASGFTSYANSENKIDNKPVKQRSAKTSQPNVVFILVDDMGYGELSHFGQTKIRLPNLDQMAAEGRLFTQFYAGNTICAPSRASLMTGKHTGHTDIRGNFGFGGYGDDEEFGQLPLRPGAQTLGTVMKSAGYTTAAIGKWGLGGPGSIGVPNKQGFDYFYGYLDQRQAHNHTPTHLWLNEQSAPLNNTFLNVHPKKLSHFDENDPRSYDQFKREDFAQERMNQKAVEFIHRHKHTPFFLYLAYAMPHAALQAPDEEIEKYNFPNDKPSGTTSYLPVYKPRATRAAMMSYTDKHVGEVLSALKENQLDKNTLVIFTSDNGPTRVGGGDMKFFDANGPLRGYKRDLYEGGIRIPTIVWWPGHVDAGTRSDHIAAFWDVLPTLAELTGQRKIKKTDGISMLPAILGQTGQRQHDHLYWEYHKNRNNQSQAIRQGKWKAIKLYKRDKHGVQSTRFELFDLSQDLGESKNLSKQYPELVKKYDALMTRSRTRSWIDHWNFD